MQCSLCSLSSDLLRKPTKLPGFKAKIQTYLLYKKGHILCISEFYAKKMPSCASCNSEAAKFGEMRRTLKKRKLSNSITGKFSTTLKVRKMCIHHCITTLFGQNE